MDVFHKFYTKLYPLAEKEVKERKLPSDAASTVLWIAREMIFVATKVYTRDIMKDKFHLEIDLSDKHCIIPTEEQIENHNPIPFFEQNISPCEICGHSRIIEKCHIIPRQHGGFDDTENIITLCANHHKLFDSNKLTKEEWAKLNWETKAPSAREYAEKIRYNMHVMYWKYNYPCIASCVCGSQDFELTYYETDPIIRNGQVEVMPGSIVKKLLCKNCGDYYEDFVFKQKEYEWWRQYVRQMVI